MRSVSPCSVGLLVRRKSGNLPLRDAPRADYAASRHDTWRAGLTALYPKQFCACGLEFTALVTHVTCPDPGGRATAIPARAGLAGAAGRPKRPRRQIRYTSAQQ